MDVSVPMSEDKNILLFVSNCVSYGKNCAEIRDSGFQVTKNKKSDKIASATSFLESK